MAQGPRAGGQKRKSLSALIREQLEALTREKSELEEVTEKILTIMQEHSGTLSKWCREELYGVPSGTP
ncbi:hypothetical protein [Thermodesulfatator autotrophicus]|uniref:hypothetical protein n=1 Tax=Thermodesulfatator autotrophicus TaxID=1795632 RepID=UPI0018D3803D|nr:hypothetical protein [Thermodesulfatator autotrophicus]